MECCQCQQERQKYLKQICRESRGATPWGRVFFQVRQKNRHRPGSEAASTPSLPGFCSLGQHSRSLEQEGGNSGNAAGRRIVLSFQHGHF